MDEIYPGLSRQGTVPHQNPDEKHKSLYCTSLHGLVYPTDEAIIRLKLEYRVPNYASITYKFIPGYRLLRPL